MAGLSGQISTLEKKMGLDNKDGLEHGDGKKVCVIANHRREQDFIGNFESIAAGDFDKCDIFRCQDFDDQHNKKTGRDDVLEYKL